jgi:hypothetical protein
MNLQLHSRGGFGRSSRSLPIALILAAAFWGQSCSYNGEVAVFCADQTDCLDGNRRDESVCIEESKGQRASFSAYGCSEEYDALWGCWYREFRCNGRDGTDYWTDTDNCSAEENHGYTCVSLASGLYGYGY